MINELKEAEGKYHVSYAMNCCWEVAFGCTHPYRKHPPNRAVWDDCTTGMDYKGARGVLARLSRWVPTCSAITAPAHPAGQSHLAFVKPNKLQNHLQGFCKMLCEASTCWPVCSRAPEHGCPQKGDLGGSATAQAQPNKSSHAVESVQNPGTPTSPLCPGQHRFPWDHARGPTIPAAHPTPPGDVPQGRRELPAQPCAEQRLPVHTRAHSLVAPSPRLAARELPRASAAAGGRRPVAPTSLCWPRRAGLLLRLACSSPELAFNRMSGIKWSFIWNT